MALQPSFRGSDKRAPGQGHCVVFLGKTLSHSASTNQMYKYIKVNLMLGGNPAMK